MATVKIETEHVLVIPTSLFHKCGYFQGFNSDVERFLPCLLAEKSGSYRPRDQMEVDPNFKQLIPYCIFRYVDRDSGEVHLFQYTRGNKQGERRLHSKQSIGVGGHISTLDVGDDSPYKVGLNRELAEEVRIETGYNESCVGLINDDENEVGKVHLGIVHMFDVEKPNVTANESAMVDAGFVPVGKLIDGIDNFETWSQICLRALF